MKKIKDEKIIVHIVTPSKSDVNKIYKMLEDIEKEEDIGIDISTLKRTDGKK
jgi:hypothetical protein